MISTAAIKLAVKTRKFWLILAFLAIWIGSYAGVYQWGKASQRAETAAEVVKEAKKEVKEIKAEVVNRTPVIEKAVIKTEKIHQSIKRGQEKLDEAIKERGPSPVNCDLSDAELRAFRELEAKD